ncbi:LytR/AlgR family response regulator transcription factor [Bacteroides sp.]
MKCLAIDDEPLALAQLSGYISRVPFLSLLKSCHDAFEAMETLAEVDVDLIFVDINMPDLNGLDFVRSLVVKPLIVFTTAYSEYAVESFKVDAVDYLLKPFEFQDLLKAADKARKQHEYRLLEQGYGEGASQINGSLFVKSECRVVRIDIAEIKYIEGMSEYVRIFVEGEERPVVTLMSLHKLEERLPAQQFMRVHRSYIVNLHKITEISRLRIIFDKNTYIPVGENYKERFTEYIEKLM